MREENYWSILNDFKLLEICYQVERVWIKYQSISYKVSWLTLTLSTFECNSPQICPSAIGMRFSVSLCVSAFRCQLLSFRPTAHFCRCGVWLRNLRCNPNSSESRNCVWILWVFVRHQTSTAAQLSPTGSSGWTLSLWQRWWSSEEGRSSS